MKKLILFTFVLFSFYIGYSQQTCANVTYSFDDPRLLLESNQSATADSVMLTSLSIFDNGDWEIVEDLTFNSDEAFYVSSVFGGLATQRYIQSPIFRVENPTDKIYLSFDHICKMLLATSQCGIRVQTGPTEALSGPWTQIQFNTLENVYYGNYDGTVNGGIISQNMYEDWEPTNNTAVPDASWWKHELMDITSLVNPDANGYFRIRFVLTRANTTVGEDLAGWYIDNINVRIADHSLIPPVITLEPPIEQNNVNHSGPYDIEAEIVPNGVVNGVLYPDSVRLFYNEDNGPFILVEDKTIDGDVYAWTIPQQCHGTQIDYYITAQDVNCNETRLDKEFTVNLPTTGTTTNGAEAIDFTDVPDYFEVGAVTPLSFILKNRTNNPSNPSNNNMDDAVITWQVEAENSDPETITLPPYNWSSEEDFHPTRPFCMNLSDTIQIGSFTPVFGFNTLTACITTRNGQANNYAEASRCATVTRYGCDAEMMGIYEIGTEDALFANLQALYDAIDNCVMDGPITIKLAPGTYNGEDFMFTENFSGQSEINTITYEPINGDPTSVVIVDNNNVASATSGAITFKPAASASVGNFIFKNLTLQGKSGSSWSRGVAISGGKCENITIQNCIITVEEPPTATNAGYAGIVRPTANTSNDVDENIIIVGNTITGGAYGITYIGNASRSGVITRLDSNVIASYTMGINCNYTDVEQIKANRITKHEDSEFRFTGLSLQASERTTEVTQNRINVGHDMQAGMLIKTVEGVEATDFVLVTNNEVIGVIEDGNSYGINNASVRTKYINNSVKVTSNEVVDGVTAAYYHASGTNAVVRNNVFVNEVETDVADPKNYAVYVQTAPSALVDFDYNVYVSPNTVGFYASARRASLAAWQFAIEGSAGDDAGKDLNAITTEPPFVSSDDSLSMSSYIGFNCTVHQDALTDITGKARICNATHRGAYEGIIPTVDLAMLEVLAPIAETCPQSTYPLIVKIANYGCQDVNFVTTPVSIRFISEALNLDTPYSINPGPMTSGDEAVITLNPNLTLPINVSVDMMMIISHPDETNPLNDTIEHTFYMNVINPEIEVYDEVFSNGTTKEWQLIPLTGAGEWSFQQGVGVDPEIAPVYGSGRLFFNSRNFPTGSEARAIMPPINLSTGGTPIIEVWFAHDNQRSKTLEGVTLKISTDNGTTWVDLEPETPNPAGITNQLLKRYKAGSMFNPPAFAKYTYRLTDYNTQSCVFVAFDALGQAGNNINIDRVRVRKLYDNDCAVNQIYTTHKRPTEVEVSSAVSAVVSNEGANDLSNYKIYLDITGANTYKDSIVIPSLDYNTSQIVTFPSAFLPNNGQNNVAVYPQTDDNGDNDLQNWSLVTSPMQLSYADTSTAYISVGDLVTPMTYVSKFDIVDTLIASKVYVFPTDQEEMVGQRVIAFVSNEDGEILSTSDTLTFTAEMVNTWVPMLINNYALTVSIDELYIGIQQVTAGTYLTAQEELPVREATYYTMNEDAEYEELLTGRLMMKADVEDKIQQELGLLVQTNPTTRCDLEVEPISVRITNNGLQEIPGNTIIFHYRIDDGPVVTETMEQAIASEEITVFSFDQMFDFTNNQIGVDETYTVKVWIDSLSADRVRFNDTIVTTFDVLGKSPNPGVISPIICQFSSPATLEANLPAGIESGVFQWYTKEGDTWYGPEYQGPGPYVTPYNFYFDTTMYVAVSPGTVSEVTVGTGTINNAQPFYFTAGYSRGRILYRADEIGQYGQISKITLTVAGGSNGEEGVPMKVYIKQTDVDGFVTSEPLDWDALTEGALCIYDGQRQFEANSTWEIPFTQPFYYSAGNIMILTETNCGGTNCSAVSAGTTYPTFKSTSVPTGTAQYRRTNDVSNFTGSWASVTKRFNVDFTIADIECGSQRALVEIDVQNIPNYDIRTDALIFPEPFVAVNCALYEEQIQVNYTNMLNVDIPAGTFKAVANFDGDIVEHIINEEFAPNEVKTVTFTPRVDFSAPSVNRVIDFEIYSDIIGDMTYRSNDTIYGNVKSTRTAPLDTTSFTSYFSLPYTIDLDVQGVSQYYFYETEDATTTLPGGNNVPDFTTPLLYDTIVYYAAARTPASPYCTTSRFPVTIYVEQPAPAYDIATKELFSPISYTCGLTSADVILSLNNTYQTQIPGSIFEIIANFSSTLSSEKVITQTFASTPLQTENPDIVYDTLTNVALSSLTQNQIYNYEIFTKAIDPAATVVTFNDTVYGELRVPASPVAPPALTYNVPYGLPYTINPYTNTANMIFASYQFFDNAEDTIVGDGVNYVTPPIYGNTTFDYTGRIVSEGFHIEETVGTASSSGAYPFVFTATASQGMALYSKEDLGGYAGTIDTIALNIHADIQGSFPIKLYLKNTDLTALTAGNKNWNNEIENATLIYEGTPEFNQGWIQFPVEGGFYFDGEGLLLMTEHDCYGLANVAALGIAPSPAFKYTNAQGTVIYRGGEVATGNANFSLTAQRPNLKYSMNYACFSPKSTVTINTNRPAVDLEMVEVISPLPIQETYTANELIRLEIANHGTSMASGFSISYVYDGQAPVTVPTPQNITAGGSATILLNPADFSDVYFEKTLVVYTTSSSDNFHNNDTITMTLARPYPCSPKVVVGPKNDLLTFISAVNFANGGIDNVQQTEIFNTDNDPYEGMFTDYSSEVDAPDVVQGQTYPIRVTNSFVGNGVRTYKYAYIDLNKDNVFSPDELVFSALNVSAPTATTPELATSEGIVSIPADAELGMTRLRVITSTTALNTTTETNVSYAPCANFNSGEMEDYAINVMPPFEIDPGLLSPIHPLGDVCPDTTGHVKILLQNYGDQTLTFTAENPITITANITGPVNGTYQTIVDDGMTLEQWDNTEIVIYDANYSAAGLYEVEVTLAYAADMYAQNNVYQYQFEIASADILSAPYTFTFDSLGWKVSETFPAAWRKEGMANYYWEVDSSTTINYPDAGPNFDHTLFSTYLEDPKGHYALVAARGAANATYEAVLHTPCLNLHYENGLPVEVTYWKHIYGRQVGATQPTVDLKVAVGSGTDYVDIDLVEGPVQTDSLQVFKDRTIPLDRAGIIDRVGKLRFTVTHRTGSASAPIDVAIDDISIVNTVPDVGVERFIFPLSCGSGENDTIQRGDTIRPRVVIKNHSLVPVTSFQVFSEMRFAAEMSTISENWNGLLMPGEEMEFEFVTYHVIPTLSYINRVDFQAYTVIPIFNPDKNPLNDRKNAQPCATVDISDYASEYVDGAYLGQNEPNPAIEMTKIPYVVPTNGKAIFEIYTLEGQLLYKDEVDVDPGEHYYELNTSQFASGMYMYTMYFNDVKMTKKMVIGQ